MFKEVTFLTISLFLMGLGLLSSTASAEDLTLIALDFRPRACNKAIHRSMKKWNLDIVLLYSGTDPGLPERIDPHTITMEGGTRPIRVKLRHFGDPKAPKGVCTLKGRKGDPMLVATFPIRPVLATYDWNPYGKQPVIAVLMLEAQSFPHSPPDPPEHFVGYANFRIVD